MVNSGFTVLPNEIPYKTQIYEFHYQYQNKRYIEINNIQLYLQPRTIRNKYVISILTLTISYTYIFRSVIVHNYIHGAERSKRKDSKKGKPTKEGKSGV